MWLILRIQHKFNYNAWLQGKKKKKKEEEKRDYQRFRYVSLNWLSLFFWMASSLCLSDSLDLVFVVWDIAHLMRIGRSAATPPIDYITFMHSPYLVSFMPLHVVRRYFSSNLLAPSSSANSVLVRDKLLCSAMMTYTWRTVCSFSLLNTLTNSSLLHKTPTSIGLHVSFQLCCCK